MLMLQTGKALQFYCDQLNISHLAKFGNREDWLERKGKTRNVKDVLWLRYYLGSYQIAKISSYFNLEIFGI